jgi:hypothetical protein
MHNDKYNASQCVTLTYFFDGLKEYPLDEDVGLLSGVVIEIQLSLLLVL